MKSCLYTVAKCIELLLDRFSMFGYTHVPSFKKHQRKIDESDLPDCIERHRSFERHSGSRRGRNAQCQGIALPHLPGLAAHATDVNKYCERVRDVFDAAERGMIDG